MTTEPMNVIRVTDGNAVWWHVTKGNMAVKFHTVADYIPDEATAHRIAASEMLLESLMDAYSFIKNDAIRHKAGTAIMKARGESEAA